MVGKRTGRLLRISRRTGTRGRPSLPKTEALVTIHQGPPKLRILRLQSRDDARHLLDLTSLVFGKNFQIDSVLIVLRSSGSILCASVGDSVPLQSAPLFEP